MAEAAVIVEALGRLRRGECRPAAETAAPTPPSRSRRRRGGLSLNLTPMIDVTFLLLVFFVCTTRALERESLLRADLTAQASVAPVDALSLDEPPLRIAIGRNDGQVTLRIDAPLPQPGSVEELVTLLQQRRFGPGNPTGLFSAEQPIELAPTKDAPWEDAVAIFNAVTRAGYTRVGFARPG